MTDISISGTTRFSVRCAALFIEKNKILIHRKTGDRFYTLPGGKCKLGEDSKHAVEREILEELNFGVKIERLILIGENFFRFKNSNHHEILFVHLASKQSAKQLMKVMPDERLIGDLIFKWVQLEDVKKMTLNPPFVYEFFTKEGLLKSPIKLSHVSNY